MVTEMTRERRLHRTLGFAILMFFLCALAIGFDDSSLVSIPTIALVFNTMIWAALIGSTQAELSHLRLVNLRKEDVMKKG